MNIIIKTKPGEVERARKWWNDLEMQWKFAYNEAVFGKGPTVEPPREDELMLLLIQVDTLRFAGPMAINPNLSFELDNLSGLVPLYQLKYLSVSNMKFTSLEPLKRHVNLEHLFVYENKLTSLHGIEKMSKLKELYCQSNQLTSLKPIKNLHELETIYATNNELEKIDGLNKKHKKQLKKLYILPNDKLRDEEIIRVQNKVGILCRKG